MGKIVYEVGAPSRVVNWGGTSGSKRQYFAVGSATIREVRENGAVLPGRTGLNFTTGIIATDDPAGDEAEVYLDTSYVQVRSERGATNGYASLDSSGDVPDAQIPTSIARAADVLLKALADAKGDLLVATAADAFARLAVGADGLSLIADAASSGGVKWDGAVLVQDEGTPQARAQTINFTGAGVTASVAAGVATVNVTGGGAGVTSVIEDARYRMAVII